MPEGEFSHRLRWFENYAQASADDIREAYRRSVNARAKLVEFVRKIATIENEHFGFLVNLRADARALLTEIGEDQ